jgi:hypothetical protein
MVCFEAHVHEISHWLFSADFCWQHAAVKVETEQQAKARAKALAKQDYLATYNAAIKVNNIMCCLAYTPIRFG